MKADKKPDDKLTTFAELVSRLDTPTLRALRARCANLRYGTWLYEVVLDAVDGQLALREMTSD